MDKIVANDKVVMEVPEKRVAFCKDLWKLVVFKRHKDFMDSQVPWREQPVYTQLGFNRNELEQMGSAYSDFLNKNYSVGWVEDYGFEVVEAGQYVWEEVCWGGMG